MPEERSRDTLVRGLNGPKGAFMKMSAMNRAYRPLLELGRGGTARIYLAESLASGINKLVVLKVLNPELRADSEMRAAFRQEAELSARMNHPNIAQVLEIVECRDTPVIVMEYLDGTSLSILRRRAGLRFPLPLHLYILSEVLAGLHHLHELRDLDGACLHAVHRDVSPQNVMVSHDGAVKVLDFGIAKTAIPNGHVTRTGVIKGKFGYMPPEQLLGEQGIDRRADVFAVGIMLWEAAAGRRMWAGMSEKALLESVVTGSVPRLRDFAPSAPDCVRRIVERATAIDREDRFATAQEMQKAIDLAIADQGWVVQSHELADLMLQHFGESRHARELEIKSALRRVPGHEVMLATASSSGLPRHPTSGEEPGRPTLRTGSGVWISRALHTDGRKRARALAVLCSLVLFATWALGRRGQARSDAAESQVSKTVMLDVEALPPGSEILLDGRPLGTDRFVGPQPSTDRKVALEVRAPGHLCDRRELTLRGDTVLKITLEPNAAGRPGLSGSVSAPLAPSSSRSRMQTSSVVADRPRAPAPARSNRSNRCKPPYTFSSDGVKTYKPECF